MTLPRRVDPRLIIGDTVAILAFAALGRAEHQTGIHFAGIVSTAAPFLAAWYAVGFWLRTFHPDRTASPLAAVRSVLLPWLLAWPLGLQMRALFLDRNIPFSFALVVLVTVLLLLVGWRLLFAFWRRSRSA